MEDSIRIRGARQNNLRNLDLDLPRGKLIVVSGVSGSGKSSLAFDTLYAEGQRRYIESLSTYTKQYLEKMDKPDVDEISGLSPAIAIRQKNPTVSSRSTVGTSTEIYDYLRLLWSRVGVTMCPGCAIPVRPDAPSGAPGMLAREWEKDVPILITYPLDRVTSGKWKEVVEGLLYRGFIRIVRKGRTLDLEPVPAAPRGKEPDLVLVDRLPLLDRNASRIVEGVETAYKMSAGRAVVVRQDTGERVALSEHPHCSGCERLYPDTSPLFFSFNSPYGACPDCRGFGDRMEFDEKLIIPDDGASIRGGAIAPWEANRFEYLKLKLETWCRSRKIPVTRPWRQLDAKVRREILEGAEGLRGVIPFLQKIREKRGKKYARFFYRRFMSFTRCRTCEGGRLRREAYNVKVGGKSIHEVAGLQPSGVLDFLDGLEFGDSDASIARDILLELRSRLSYLVEIGLDYLTLDRLTRTLSGGEAQRINLSNSLGSQLIETLYVLDEPSIGLHPRDNDRLVRVLKTLKDLGNTVLVVEHDPEILRAGDYLVDLGPGAGENGGEITYAGPISKRPVAGESLTLQYLYGKRRRSSKSISPSRKKARARGPDRAEPEEFLEIRGARLHNLKDIDLKIPLGRLVLVTGVSGSGKSSLVCDLLFEGLQGRRSGGSGPRFDYTSIRGAAKAGRVLMVDQTPVGRSPRSNPVTYIGAFSGIRDAFSRTPEAVRRGFGPARFSFNVRGGRCSQCEGMGYNRIEMHFMADVFVRCPECGGKRFNPETLEVRYRGKNIHEVLELTVTEAMSFFHEQAAVSRHLWSLQRVGLGYLRLGQAATTLSGGEAQRMKIARELAQREIPRSLYIFDEPTTGLHMHDVERLIDVLYELVSGGHSVIVIEHNLEMIRAADYIFDLGPEGGENGGHLVAEGRPEDIAACNSSHTGSFLRSGRGARSAG